jgi:hypothetical protein
LGQQGQPLSGHRGIVRIQADRSRFAAGFGHGRP